MYSSVGTVLVSFCTSREQVLESASRDMPPPVARRNEAHECRNGIYCTTTAADMFSELYTYRRLLMPEG